MIPKKVLVLGLKGMLKPIENLQWKLCPRMESHNIMHNYNLGHVCCT